MPPHGARLWHTTCRTHDHIARACDRFVVEAMTTLQVIAPSSWGAQAFHICQYLWTIEVILEDDIAQLSRQAKKGGWLYASVIFTCLRHNPG